MLLVNFYKLLIKFLEFYENLSTLLITLSIYGL